MATTDTTTQPDWLDRLDQLDQLTDTREVTRQSEVGNAMLGVLAGLVDNETWNEALDRVGQVTT